MNGIDIAILVVMGLSLFTGLMRGFVKELLALLTWLIALVVAYRYGDLLYPWLAKYTDDPNIQHIAGFVLLLIACLLLGAIVNALLSALIHKSGLGGTDRVLGMGFGAIRGAFIVSVMILVANLTSISDQDYLKQSKLYHQFDPIVNWLHEKAEPYIAKFHEQNKTITTVQQNAQMVFNPFDD